MRSRKKWLRMVRLWCFLCIGCLLVLTMFIAFSRGELTERWFFFDTRDSAMDFFNSIVYVRSDSPYADYQTLYPPLANALFSLILKFIPRDLRAQWPEDFGSVLRLKSTEMDLRTYQSLFIPFLLFVMISVLAFLLLFEDWISREKRWVSRMAAVCAVFSYGSLYGFERGNIIVISFLLTAFFIRKRQDENPLVRELALIALAVAAGMKLYPAVFGLLLITDRDYASAFRTVLYGLAAFFLPFLFYDEGLAGFRIWLDTLLHYPFPGADTPAWSGGSISSALCHLAMLLEEQGVILPDKSFVLIGYLTAALLCLLALLQKKDWARVLTLCLALLAYSPQADYTYIFVLLPLFELFREERYMSGRSFFPFLGLSVYTLPLPIFYERGVFYPRSTIFQITLVLLIVYMLGLAIGERVRRPARKHVSMSV